MVLVVHPNELDRLSPDDAVDVLRELLWCEVASSHLPAAALSVPSNVTAADGGIDAEVNAGEISSVCLKPGLTRYQIKTGPFSLNKSNLKKLLFKKG